MIDVAHCRLLPVGADAAATITAAAADWDKEVNGEVMGVAIDLTNQPNTVDITVPHPNCAAINLFAKSNLSADLYAAPRVYALDNAGSALSSNVTPEAYCAKGFPAVVVAGGDAGATKYVDVWIWFRTN